MRGIVAGRRRLSRRAVPAFMPQAAPGATLSERGTRLSSWYPEYLGAPIIGHGRGATPPANCRPGELLCHGRPSAIDVEQVHLIRLPRGQNVRWPRQVADPTAEHAHILQQGRSQRRRLRCQLGYEPASQRKDQRPYAYSSSVPEVPLTYGPFGHCASNVRQCACAARHAGCRRACSASLRGSSRIPNRATLGSTLQDLDEHPQHGCGDEACDPHSALHTASAVGFESMATSGNSQPLVPEPIVSDFECSAQPDRRTRAERLRLASYTGAIAANRDGLARHACTGRAT